MKQIRILYFFVLFLFSALHSWGQLPAITLGVAGNASGCAPHTVVFNLSSFSGNTLNTTYAFDFGDGTPIVNYTQSTIPASVSHTYTNISCGQIFGGQQNCYGATLTATNSAGSTAGTVQPIRISKKPNASFTLSPTPICSGSSITFTNISDPGVTYSGATCNTNPPYYWAVTGPSAGTVTSGTLGSNGTFPANINAWSTGSSPLTMQFTTPGSYQMKLSIGNSCGIDDTTLNFCVVAQPQPQFSVNPAIGCYPPALNVAATNSTVVTANACFPTTYAYNWSVSPASGWAFNAPGTATSTNTNFTFSAVGNYTVTLQASVNNLVGCSATTTQQVTVNQAPTVNAGNDLSVCASGATVQLTGSPTGGTWSGTGVNSSGLYTPPSSAGSATLTYTISAAASCPSLSDQLIVTINPRPTVSIAPLTPSICNGSSVSLTASSSIASSTFSWSPSTGLSPASGATVSANPTSTTTYTVTGTAPITGCSNTANVTVTVNPNPTVTVPNPTAICVGGSTSLTASGAGGLGPYTYAWSPALGLNTTSGATVTANPTITSTYTVTVTDSRGCTGTNTVTVTVNAIPSVNAGNDLSICNGSGANTLTGFSPAGGTWSGTGVTAAGVFTPAAVGTVTLTYSVSQNGCTATDQIIVSVIAPTAANAGADQGICLNAAAINLTGTPANGSWTGSALVTTAGVFTPSAAGVYTLTYTIGSGSCLATDQKVVTVHALPTVSVNDPVICAGTQATLSAAGSGGLSPYTYAWSPATGLSASTGATVTTSPSASTSYTVTVSDARLCTATDVSNITVNPIPTVDAGINVSICNGSGANTLTGFTPTNGTWSGTGVTSAGVFTPSALGNVTLTYSVTQTGCTGTDQIVVTVIAPTTANAGNDQGICLNAPAINLTGTPTGGNWSGSALVTSAGLFTPSAVGTYTLTYTFGTGSCTATDQKIVTVYALPSVTVNDPTICAGVQATLTAVGAGGLSPYTYSWSPATGLSGSTGASVTTSPLASTSHTVTVSDANSCIATDVSNITVNPIPTVNAGIDVGVCNTPNTYTLNGFSPAGGTWTGTGVTSGGVFTPNGVASVTLTYSVTQNLCTGSDVVVLNVTDPVPANAGLDQGVCLNAPALSLTGTPSGGTWSGDPLVTLAGLFTPSAVGSCTLTYSFGSGNCLVTDQKIVTVHSLPTVTVNDPTICAGEQTTLTAEGANGLAPYTYAWSPSAGLSATTGAVVTTSPPSSTSYTATVTDANSCTATDANSITVNAIPTADAGPDITICTGSGNNTLVDFSPAGGTWSGTGVTPTGIFTPTVTGLVTLTYSVEENGCTGTNDLEINVINPTAANAGIDQALCQNAPDLTLSGLPVNGAWTGTNVTTAGVFTPIAAGTYTLTYTIGSGSCSASDDVDVLVYDLPDATVNDPAFCIGLGANLTASASGGASPYSYSWNASTDLSTLLGATTTANPSASSDFIVTVTDDNACTDTAISQVQVNALPIVNAGLDISVCNTPTETTLSGFSPVGGTWTGTGVTTDGVYTPTGVGNFDLTYSFTDANGCINTDIVTAAVTDPDNVEAGIDQSVCQNSPDVQLVGSPTGGNWIVSTYLTNTGIFTPSTVGEYSVKYTVGTGTCAVVDSLLITVLELPLVAGSDVTICAQDSIEISVTGSLGAGNYTYTWLPTDSLNLAIDSVVQAFPIITTTYTVTVTDANMCTGATDILVNVNQLPLVDAGTDFTVCFTPIPSVLSGATPLGGTWSGAGVTNSEFVPPAAGTETIYYTYTEASTGCINLDSILITAINPDVVNAGNDTSVCITYDPFLITGQTPLGGNWTGDAQVIADGTFTASQVGSVTLTYTTGSGTCAVSDERIVNVQALPIVEAGLDTNICVNSPDFNFSGELPTSLGSWTWTGIGISDGSLGTFSATQSSAGVFTSVYTYTETATGCTNSDSLLVTVNSLTPVNVVSEIIDVCLTPFNTMLNANPLGGVWTGSDINFLYNIDAIQDTAGFVPTVNGTFQAFYTYTDQNNCVNADTSIINVVSPIDAVAGPDVSFCYSTTDTFQLSGLAIVGTWTDPLNPTWLLEDGTLTPIQPDTTNLIITIGSGSCQTWDTTQVVVFPLPFIDAGVDTFRCFQDPCFQLNTPIPTGGVWSGNGITDPNGLFCSTIAGEGVQVLYYNIDTTYFYQTVQSTCLNEDSIEVLVVPMPVPGLSIDPVLCVNVDYTLGNESSGPAADFEWTIVSLPLNDIVYFSTDPTPTINLTVPGNYQLTLNSISPYGCSVSTSFDFIVVTPPVPEFAISADLECAPYQGSILNTSTGYNLTYDWNFGPLFPSSALDSPPLPVFPSPIIGDSLFYVELSLTNLCGTRTYTDSITIRPLPVAVITTDYSIGCSPTTIVFQNISYGSPETFLWDFDNGTTSTDSLPAPLVFQAINFPQTFDVTVSVTNSCGVDTDTASITIYPNSFSIGSILPQTACAPFEFSFQSPSTGQTFYLWDFGDGEGAIGESVTHLYPNAGNYTVQLTVSNFCFSDTVFSSLQLLEGPALDFDLSASSICENTEVTMNNTSTIGSNYSWLIDTTPTPSYSSPITQLFNEGGDFSIGLSGANPTTGCIDTLYKPLTVWARPTIQIAANPDTGCVPLLATFTNNTQNATSYEWNFSNGTGSAQAEPSLLISGLGAFTAELIAHNYQSSLIDCPDTASIQVWVNPTPTSLFALSADAGCGPPANVQTINQSSNNLTFQWEWLGGMSSLSAPEISFTDTGLQVISLRVTNQYQCSDTSSKSYQVFGQPDIAFNLIPIEGCTPLKVDFLNLTEYGDSVSWGFGDGNFSTLPVAEHTYQEPGLYAVELFVSTGNGLCYDDTLASQAVWVHPVANSAFSADPLIISQDAPLIYLNNNSDGYNSLEFFIDTVLVSDELPSAYMFQNPDSGLVQLMLIANNEFGCPDTSTQDVMIKSAPSFYFPNTFSPNGDGKNDEYRVYFDRAPTFYSVAIYDRWGLRVFESTDYNEAWDGTFMNRGGEPIKCDVYVLKFSAIFEGTIKFTDLYRNVNVIH